MATVPLATLTSNSTCSYHGHSINLHVGLSHDSCLLFDPAEVSLVRQSVTGLVGTNGSGKTSLAKTIASKDIPNFPKSLSIQYISSHENYALDEEQHATLKPQEFMALKVQEKLMSLKEQIENLEQQLEGENADVDVEAIANELAELYDRQEELDVSSE
eukprot:scaffold332_cov117-Cylindrotheca_fusiformis.AAC.1